MSRNWTVLLAAVMLLVCLATTAVAQEAWPIYPLDGHEPQRGPGGYLSFLKMAFCIGWFLLWVKTADWVNRDCSVAGMRFQVWNPIVVGTFLLALLLAWSVPYFAIGFICLVAGYLVPLGVYVFQRNAQVDSHEKVMTADHFASLLGNRRAPPQNEGPIKNIPQDRGPPIGFLAMGAATEVDNKSNLLAAKHAVGFLPARELISDAIARRAEKAILEYSKETVSVRYEVDGVWHDAGARDRESGDALLAVMKKLANMDPDDRRSRQAGRFGAQYNSDTYVCDIVAQGTKTGERVVVKIDDQGDKFKSLDDLGMRPKVQENLKELLSASQGLVLFCALPSGGLSTTVARSLGSTDRFVRDFVAVEDQQRREQEVENVEVKTYNSGEQETLTKCLDDVAHTEPDVVIVQDATDATDLRTLCRLAAENCLVISTVRAKEAVEALLRVMALKVPAEELAPAVSAVINQRLVRKLCEDCKEAYAPTPELLSKLGIPAGRIEVLYRELQVVEGKPCHMCGGLGYIGRTAIFELLVVNDALRDALRQNPELENLRNVARKSGLRSLQEEGIVLVARGETSLTELMRVLKQ